MTEYRRETSVVQYPTKQQRCEQSEPNPNGIDVEVSAESCTYAAEFGIPDIAVETARNTGIAFDRLVGIFGTRYVFGIAELCDDVFD